MWFIDANADRMSFAKVMGDLAKHEGFRAYFLAAIAETDARSYVLEMPLSMANSEFECAITEAPVPKKVKVDPAKYASAFTSGESVAVVPDGDASLIVPRAEQVEGWYADLPTFLKRIREEQQHALLQAVARTAQAALANGSVCVGSSAPGAPWLSFRVGPSAKALTYSRYRR
jgi:hypothetical protein